MSSPDSRPVLALTMGDVAGIGPEVIARLWAHPDLHAEARPLVIGDPDVLTRALGWVRRADPSCFAGGVAPRVESIARAEVAAPSPSVIPCFMPSDAPRRLIDVTPGTIDGRAGRAARDFLMTAADLALEGRVAGIVTLPLHKEALRAGGITVPGHTEMLAERCGVSDYAMMLYLDGLGVIHVTLHMALRDVFPLITTDRILEKILLAHRALGPLAARRPPRIAVAGLNPHAGEHGLFGDEEITAIAPAVAAALRAGCDVVGPIAADTLFAQALAGAFDGVIAMYHDQGHIALKTASFDRAVNVTLGLPITRTSVAHGTAFDIVGQGLARADSLRKAVDVATRLVTYDT